MTCYTVIRVFGHQGWFWLFRDTPSCLTEQYSGPGFVCTSLLSFVVIPSGLIYSRSTNRSIGRSHSTIVTTWPRTDSSLPTPRDSVVWEVSIWSVSHGLIMPMYKVRQFRSLTLQTDQNGQFFCDSVVLEVSVWSVRSESGLPHHCEGPVMPPTSIWLLPGALQTHKGGSLSSKLICFPWHFNEACCIYIIPRHHVKYGMEWNGIMEWNEIDFWNGIWNENFRFVRSKFLIFPIVLKS